MMMFLRTGGVIVRFGVAGMPAKSKRNPSLHSADRMSDLTTGKSIAFAA